MNNPVAPIVGHYALLRNGSFVHPECITKDFDLDGTPYYLSPNSDDNYYWTANGVCQRQAYPKGIPKLIFVPDCDIIATISPADMQAAASGELERLRAALQKLHDGLAWDWRGHPVGDLPTLREIAREALAKMEESK